MLEGVVSRNTSGSRNVMYIGDCAVVIWLNPNNVFLNGFQSKLINPLPDKLCLRVCSTGLLENAVGKGEIALNEQFLLFPQRFLPVWRAFCHFHQA